MNPNREKPRELAHRLLPGDCMEHAELGWSHSNRCQDLRDAVEARDQRWEAHRASSLVDDESLRAKVFKEVQGNVIWSETTTNILRIVDEHLKAGGR